MERNLRRRGSDGQNSFSSRGEIAEEIEELQTELRDCSVSDDSSEKIFVAVGKDCKEGKSVLMWALQNSPRSNNLVLVHVHCPDKMVPMGLGGKLPASKISEQKLALYRRQEREKMNGTLGQYLEICAMAKVKAETLVIEMDDIAKGLVKLIHDHGILHLIMGAASDRNYARRMMFPSSRKAKIVQEKAASCCRISFVCKNNLVCVREPDIRDSTSSSTPESENSTLPSESQLPIRAAVIPPQEIQNIVSQGENLRAHSLTVLRSTGMEVGSGSSSPSSHLEIDALKTRFEDLRRQEIPTAALNDQGLRTHSVSTSRSSGNPLYSSVYEVVNSPTSPSAPRLDDVTGSLYSLDAQEDMYVQLQQAFEEAQNAKREIYEETCRRMKAERDSFEAQRKVWMLTDMHEREAKQRRMAEEALERESRKVDKLEAENLDTLEKLREARELRSALEAQMVQLEKNLSEAQSLISSHYEEIQDLRSHVPISLQDPGFSVFSYEELDRATRGFDSSLKIGEGGYGVVYKGTLRHTTVAIKRLHSHEDQGQVEFWQEVEILRRVRHPNLVMLIGVCPDAWCLVFEYLSNGSLEDRLACKDNSAPLPWQSRLSILTEICSALIFLHSCEPHGIVHGDLKPANVLLDSGFLSKLGDFGLSRLLSYTSSLSSSSPFLCHYTDSPKGTLAYMDPEILVTGELTVGSDVYSLGVIILRLLTARPAQRIVRDVEEALEANTFHRMLDQSAGNWPFIQANQLAHLALQCCAMTHKARPNLTTGVYRVLEPMMNSAFATPSPTCHLRPILPSDDLDSHIPSYFLCPIFHEVMRDPQVAADGYTYEGEAVRGWFEGGNHTSPMTNLVLPHQQLIPNHALHSAIEEWLQQQGG